MPVFELIQLAVNALLLLALRQLLAERRSAARERREREARLEGLAAELCEVAESIGRERRRGSLPVPAPAERPAAAPPVASRREQAEGWLARGLGVEAVAARLDMPEGEVELLRNLRRPPEGSPGRGAQRTPTRRLAAAAAASPEPRNGRGRRAARSAETAP